MASLPENIEVNTESMCRDDCIEWILKSTNEDSEFRVTTSKSIIMIMVDKTPFKP